MFISVDGKAKEVTEIFAGGTDGKAHKITELFGSVNGIAKQLYTSAEEKEPNGFDQFTWAEIKQLANEGKLLEHFNKYDKVTIKLKEPLKSDLRMYIKGQGIYVNVPQAQTEMMLQIIELTETKMRLMSPRINALCRASSRLNDGSSSSEVSNKEDRRYYFTRDYAANDNNQAHRNLADAWGLTPMYDALKTIDNALPDDLRDVLSVCCKPMTYYGRNSITGATVTKFDEDMRVRQVTDNVFKATLDFSNEDIIYPVITETYYPTSIIDYLYYIRIPAEYDNFEQRRYLVKSLFGSVLFLNYRNKTLYGNEYYIYQKYAQTPYKSCYYTKGITTSEEYNDWNSTSSIIEEDYSENFGEGTIFPEMVIEADA